MTVVPIELLNPAALWLLPLLAVLVFLARTLPQRQRRVVSSLHLWSAAHAPNLDALARRPRRRDWLVVLQAAFMLAVIAALARPVIPARSDTPGAPTADATVQQDATRSSLAATPRKLAVRLTTPGNFFLERALAANPAVTLTTGSGQADVQICDGCTSAPADGIPVLIIPRGTSANAVSPLSVRLHGHPLAQGIESVPVAPALTRIPTEDADVVMRAGATPVLLARQVQRRRIVTLNADLRSASFPLSTAFPVLIANALEWLAGGDEAVLPAGDQSAAQAPETALPSELAVWFLIAALLILAIEWRVSARARRAGHRWRLAICTCLVMAVAGARLPIGSSRTAVVFVLDRSDSIPLRVQRAAVQQINAMSSAMRRDDLLGLVTFGADASMDLRPVGRHELRDAVSRVSGSGTNIERALALGRSALGGSGERRVVLLTDGNDTSGDVSRAAARAAAAHIPVDIVPLDAARMSLVPAVQTVQAPDTVRAGEPFGITVELAGQPRSHAIVGLASGSRSRMERDVVFDEGGYAAAQFADRSDAPGMYTYRAVLSTADSDDTTGGAVVNVLGPPRVLYVSSVQAPGVLSRMLSTAAMTVTRIAPSQVPIGDEQLEPFDSVVLDDVPANALTSPQMLAVTRYVEQRGGGLLLLGSARTLDAAGYPQSALGPMLPVDVSPHTGRRAPSMAFVLVFDKSGSMGDRSNGVTKIELARESALRVVSLLPATDSLGIIAFDAQPHVISAPGTDRRPGDIGAALRQVDAGGSTSIGPALEMASAWMRASPAARKHVLLITDGRTSGADADRMRGAAATRGFELSVIAIGADADRALLESAAQRSGGRAYFPDDIRQLPAIVARDASEASGGSVVNERFRPRAPHVHPVLGGIDTASLPELRGYVAGSARATAETILTSHLDDPILAAWRVGTGRVAMFTADLGGPWSAAMRQWSGFSALWMQTTRWVNRQGASDLMHLRINETDDGIDLRIDAERNGAPVGLDHPQISLRTPSGGTLQVVPRSVDAGRYEAHVAASEIGVYEIAAGATASGTNADAHVVRGFFRSGERERAVLGVNHARLAQIAATTGGRILAAGDSPYREPRAFDWLELRPALALLALVLFLLHLIFRTRWIPGRAAVEPAREAA